LCVLCDVLSDVYWGWQQPSTNTEGRVGWSATLRGGLFCHGAVRLYAGSPVGSVTRASCCTFLWRVVVSRGRHLRCWDVQGEELCHPRRLRSKAVKKKNASNLGRDMRCCRKHCWHVSHVLTVRTDQGRGHDRESTERASGTKGPPDTPARCHYLQENVGFTRSREPVTADSTRFGGQMPAPSPHHPPPRVQQANKTKRLSDDVHHQRIRAAPSRTPQAPETSTYASRRRTAAPRQR